MQHIAVPADAGYAVAYRRPNGELCALGEHPTYQSAKREADRLNAQQQARQRLEAHRAMLAAMERPRRPVRYFEADAFA